MVRVRQAFIFALALVAIASCATLIAKSAEYRHSARAMIMESRTIVFLPVGVQRNGPGPEFEMQHWERRNPGYVRDRAWKVYGSRQRYGVENNWVGSRDRLHEAAEVLKQAYIEKREHEVRLAPSGVPADQLTEIGVVVEFQKL